MLSNNKVNSLQALGSMTNKNHSIVTRLFYAVSFIFTTSAFIFYAYRSYEKWKIEPDIAVRKNHRYLGEVPFPALTICSPVFARSSTMRYKDFSSENIQTHPEVLENLNATIANYLMSNQHVCNPYYVEISERIKKYRTETIVVKLLNESFLNTDEVLFECVYGARFTDCTKMFNRVLTDRGFCYTFNMQGFNTIFNADVISEDFYSYKRTGIGKSPMFKLQREGLLDDDNETVDWTLEKGYSRGVNPNFIPVASQKGITVAIFLYLNRSESENMCRKFTNVFNYFFHLPNELPTHLHRQKFLRFYEKSTLTLAPTAYKPHKELRRLQPEVRDCFYEGERQLKFFKSYTKSNCDLECVTNFTLKHCGCVKFSMPRDKNTKVCDFDKGKCYYSAMNFWPGFNQTTRQIMDSCGCLQTCSDIKYNIALEETSRMNLNDYAILQQQGVTEDDVFSYLSITFDENFITEEESYTPYVLQNFIADTGGLLGLFIGCSILSFFELFYFFGIKFSDFYGKMKKIENESEDSFRVKVIDVKPFQSGNLEGKLTMIDLQRHRDEIDLQFQELKALLKLRDKELASVLGQIYTQRK